MHARLVRGLGDQKTERGGGARQTRGSCAILPRLCTYMHARVGVRESLLRERASTSTAVFPMHVYCCVVPPAKNVKTTACISVLFSRASAKQFLLLRVLARLLHGRQQQPSKNAGKEPANTMRSNIKKDKKMGQQERERRFEQRTH